MRVWHLCAAVVVLSTVMTLARDPAIRYGLVICVVALGEAAMSIAMGMALFHTIGLAATARGLPDLVMGLAATILILLGMPMAMLAWLFAGGSGPEGRALTALLAGEEEQGRPSDPLRKPYVDRRAADGG